MPTSKTNTHQMWQPLLQNLQRPMSSLPLWIEEVVFNFQGIKLIILSAGLIFDDLSRNFLNVSQYQDKTIQKSNHILSKVTSYLVEHYGCYAIVLSISKPLPICLLLTSILFCRKSYLPNILWKYSIFVKNRQKRTYFKLNNSFCTYLYQSFLNSLFLGAFLHFCFPTYPILWQFY